MLAAKAREHKDTLTVGRTHGVHAEPTTFGLKMARFYDTVGRDVERFEAAAEAIRVGKLSGAVGTFAHIPPEVEALTCEAFGLRAAAISTQVLPRDLHAQYVAALALAGATVETIALEVRHLQRSEVLEAEESFGKGQKGSSAMPHKRNPIGSENLTGMARLLRGYMLTAYENVALWHERDISHSSPSAFCCPTPRSRSTTRSPASRGSSRISSSTRTGCRRTWSARTGSSTRSACCSASSMRA